MTIKHVFVLMLENRSFDHFFGLSGLPGVPRPANPGFIPGATDRCSEDPPHEFDAVQSQIAGGTMTGFKGVELLGFQPAQIPVISQLAQEFLLFDNWFSSVPGPTWPNRFFVHAASSGGLATSPTASQTITGINSLKSPFRFQNGSIFDRLDAREVKWRVYHGDVQPQVLAMPGMVKRYLFGGDHFCPTMAGHPHFSDFATDVSKAGYAPSYTFIEPDYAIQIDSQFRYGDSQHPVGLVSAGERLVKYIYEALRSSPIWDSSVLLITWDEHGGFFDERPPGTATPPGDIEYNRPTDGSDPDFRFDRFGVRVPALLVSPWVQRGVLGSQVFPSTAFDHSSVIKSVFECFGLGAPLTARDSAAPGWNSGLLSAPRTGTADGPFMLSTPVIPAAATAPTAAAMQAKTGVDGFLVGTAITSLQIDRELAERTGQPTISRSGTQTPAEYRREQLQALKDPLFPMHLAEFVGHVGLRAQAHRIRAKHKAMEGQRPRQGRLGKAAAAEVPEPARQAPDPRPR